MKILFLTRLFYPHIGGVETHVYNLSKQLIKYRHTVVVITEQFDRSLKKQEQFEKITIYRIPVTEINKKNIIWYWLWQHRNLFKEADIIHAHDVAFWYFPFKLLYPQKKFYTTFHGYEGIFPVSEKAIVIRKVSEYISTGTIAIGEFIKKWYKASPDVVMYGGVDTVESLKLKVKSGSSQFKIIYIGRMDEDMGVSLYIEVLKKLKEKKVPYEFIAVGDGPLRKMFEHYGAVKGFVKDINPYIQKANVVFASSYLTILESLALQKKVVAVYTNPLKKDYLTMTPFARFICVSNNPEEVVKYIQNNNFDIIKNAFDWAKTQTWEMVAQEYIQLWKK